jgi:MFS family permease
MSYLGELRQNVRPLAAASIGCGSGLMLMHYVTTIFGPFLIKDFGWSLSQFALVGLAVLPTLFVLPFVGRITDRYGVRAAAAIGVTGMPLSMIAFSLMTGGFWLYFALYCAMLMVASFTSPIVYTRLVAADFKLARGLALTIVTITPALLGAIAAPLLTWFIELYDWRMGYRLLAGFMAVSGVVVLLLIPPHDRAAEPTPEDQVRPARADFRTIVSSPIFWIIFAGMMLCTLGGALHASQMGVMLRDNKLDAVAAASMITVYGIGTIVGRIACGLALDRFSTPIVACVSMILPAAGFALLATPYDTPLVIGAAMLLVGISVGAEADLVSYLVARYFGLNIFSTALSLIYLGFYLAGFIGALVLSATLQATGSFALFLGLMAGSVALGSLLFLVLPKEGRFEKVG